MNDGMEWYYTQNNNQVGPFSEEQFKELVKNGGVPRGTMVWNNALQNWTPIEQTQMGAYLPPNASQARPDSEFRSGSEFRSFTNPKGRTVKRSTYLLFLIFLGFFGGHKFYARNYTWGVLYLLCSFFMIGAIIVFVLLIRDLLTACNAQGDAQGNVTLN